MKYLRRFDEVIWHKDEYTESLIIGMGIFALSLIGTNKLLSFIIKRMRDKDVQKTLDIFLNNESDITVKILEDDDKFSIHIVSNNNSILDLTLTKCTKELVTDKTQYKIKLSDDEFNDLMTIILYYKTKWINNPKW